MLLASQGFAAEKLNVKALSLRVEGIDTVQFAGVDQAHVYFADPGPRCVL